MTSFVSNCKSNILQFSCEYTNDQAYKRGGTPEITTTAQTGAVPLSVLDGSMRSRSACFVHFIAEIWPLIVSVSNANVAAGPVGDDDMRGFRKCLGSTLTALYFDSSLSCRWLFNMGVGDKVKAVAEKVTGGASSPAAGPSPAEQRLLDSSKTFDTAVSQRDIASLKALLAPTVRVHQDGLSLKEDLSGLDAVTGWFQSFFDRCGEGLFACCVSVLFSLLFLFCLLFLIGFLASAEPPAFYM